jgi:GntR family transcriptional regulator / MocR family aminotransferase
MPSIESQRLLASVRLDRRLATPLFRQVYQRIREAILDGTLPPGTSLPSTRSRPVVHCARDDRAGIRTAGRRGLCRRTGGGGHDRQSGAEPTFDVGARPDIARKTRTSWRRVRPRSAGAPVSDGFAGARCLSARLVARRARGLTSIALVSQDPAGYAPLRRAIAGYLAIARGISCSTRQIFITAGYQGALSLVSRTLLAPGDAVWFENPGYFWARDALAMAGAAIIPVPVDRDGLDVRFAAKRAPKARLAVVTPSHQCPLGVTLSLPRRLELLAWAAKTGAWVIEDDYDSEFRYLGRPLPALKSLDDAGRVLYAGSFSKVISPGLRLGYLIVPLSEVDRFHYGGTSPCRKRRSKCIIVC